MFQTNAVSYYRTRASSKIGAKRYRIEVHILVDLPKFYKIIMTSRWSHSASAVRGKPKKGPWTFEEDIRLLRYIRLHGDGRWSALARAAGLQRCGKSCRLRWVNYLRPDLKRVKITEEEERVIIDLHARWGNRWSLIAERLPGRTDNEIKNYWRSHLKKKLQLSENDYNLNVSQRYCSSSTADFSNILGQATTPQSKQSVYSTVATSSSSSSSSGDGTHPRNYPYEMKMKLDIPSAASSISQEFMTNTSVDINSIPSEEALKIKGLHNIDEKGHAIQLSSTSYTSCSDPEVNCVQNDRVTGGVDASLYSFPSFERDTLSAMLSQFYSGIPLELDNIAAGDLQVSTANSGNVAGIKPLSDHHVAYEMDSCQDLGSDMILWNMSPIPSTQSELLQLPFASPNSANAHNQ